MVLAYAGLGTLCTVSLGRALGVQNAVQLQREAELRYALLRVRESAESVRVRVRVRLGLA